MNVPQAVVHGGINVAELRRYSIAPEAVLDFSASINPLGTPVKVRQAIANVDPSAYPDRTCINLREALASNLGIATDLMLIGNGSTELIHLIASVYLDRTQTAAVFTPTFGEYEAAASRQAARVVPIGASETSGFRWDGAPVMQIIRDSRAAITFLCNPNNPTGVMLSQREVAAIAGAAAPGLLVLDEAYMPFADAPWDALPLLELGNVLLLRSMTKDYGLAGARLGYLLGPSGLLEPVQAAQPSWSVNAFAQAAGVAALACEEHVAAGKKAVAEGKEFLYQELGRLGLAVLPGSANFLLVKVGDARSLRANLLRRGILVRDCASFGLPEYVRISVRRIEECRLLVESMREVRSIG